MVSDNNDGIVSECVEVTVHGAGVAAVELIEQDCAALVRAPTATRPATTNNLRMRVGSGMWVSVIAKPRRRSTGRGALPTSTSAFPGGGSNAAALNC
jgi:hypothetical protein